MSKQEIKDCLAFSMSSEKSPSLRVVEVCVAGSREKRCTGRKMKTKKLKAFMLYRKSVKEIQEKGTLEARKDGVCFLEKKNLIQCQNTERNI